MLTIAPPRFASAIACAVARATRNAPSRLVSTTLRHSSSLVWSAGLVSATPALLTRTSTCPARATLSRGRPRRSRRRARRARRRAPCARARRSRSPARPTHRSDARRPPRPPRGVRAIVRSGGRGRSMRRSSATLPEQGGRNMHRSLDVHGEVLRYSSVLAAIAQHELLDLARRRLRQRAEHDRLRRLEMRDMFAAPRDHVGACDLRAAPASASRTRTASRPTSRRAARRPRLPSRADGDTGTPPPRASSRSRRP